MHAHSTDRIKVYYKIRRRDPHKPALVFIHGFLLNNTAWRNIALDFSSKGYSTIALDLRGHGRSGRPEGQDFYSLDRLVGDVECILDKERIRNVVLIAHSIGAVIAVSFAAKHPEQIRAIVLFNPADKFCFKNPPLIYKLMVGNEKLIEGFVSFINKKFKMLVRCVSECDLNKYVKKTDAVLFSRALIETWSSAKYFYHSLYSLNLSGAFKSIRAPTLIVASTKDELVPMLIAQEIHKRIRKSKLKVIDKGHAMIMRNPEFASEIIGQFLAENKRD